MMKRKEDEKVITPLIEGGGGSEEEKRAADLLKEAKKYRPPEGAKFRIWRMIAEKLTEPKSSVWQLVFAPRRLAYLAIVALFAVALYWFIPQNEVGTGIDTTIAASQIVETSSSEKEFVADEDIKLKLFSNTKITIANEIDGTKAIRLDRGSLLTFVTPNRGRKLVIHTPYADVRVVGTKFLTAVSNEGALHLVVYEGKVALINEGGSRIVQKGGCAFASKHSLNEERCAQIKDSDGSEWVKIFEKIAPPSLPDEVVNAGNESEETVAESSPETTVEAAMPSAVTPEAKERKEKPKAIASAETPVGNLAAQKAQNANMPDDYKKWLALQTELITADSQKRLSAVTNFLSTHPSMENMPEVLTALADAHKGAGQAKEAFAIYEKIYRLNAGSTWSESALYELGNLACYSLNDPRSAIQYWERQRKLFPHGALREEAEFHLARAQVEIGRYHEARINLENFIKSYVISPHRSAALYFLATILREQEDNCRAAVETYNSYLATLRGNPPEREEAAYWRAACLEKSGDTERAQSAFRDYLTSYPEGKYSSNVRSKLQQ